MDQRLALIKLAEALAAHESVTHFAISMRALNKGDFFKKLIAGGDCKTKTAKRLLCFFDEVWPDDLEWPQGIDRPSISINEEAA